MVRDLSLRKKGGVVENRCELKIVQMKFRASWIQLLRKTGGRNVDQIMNVRIQMMRSRF